MPGKRGDDEQPDSMFSYVSPEQRIKLRGLSNVHWLVCFAAAAFNLRRLTTVMATA